MFEWSSLGFKPFSFISCFSESECDGTVAGLLFSQFHANFTSIDNTNDFIFSFDSFEIVRLIHPFVFWIFFFWRFQWMSTFWNFDSTFQIRLYPKYFVFLNYIFARNQLNKFSTVTADIDDEKWQKKKKNKHWT